MVTKQFVLVVKKKIKMLRKAKQMTQYFEFVLVLKKTKKM